MGIKYQINEDFFKKWSKKSAYILGFLFADGNLENAPYIRGRYIRFTNTDFSIIKQIKEALNSSHTIVVTPASGNRKEKYLLRIGSHKLYRDLELLGLHPRKSHNMEFPKVPGQYLADFIRGYFDGDGTIAFENIKNRPNSRLKAIFTSGSKNFLLSLADILKVYTDGYLAKVYKSRRSYQLVYRSKRAINILNFIYSTADKKPSLCLDRKYDRYKELISKPETVGCSNIFDKSSRIWTYGAVGRRTQVAKGGVCKTPMQRFNSARRLQFSLPSFAMGRIIISRAVSAVG